MIVFDAPAVVPLGGLSNLQVKNPTITTLTAEWEAADGNVQGYRVTYTPTSGGLEIKVDPPLVRLVVGSVRRRVRAGCGFSLSSKLKI